MDTVEDPAHLLDTKYLTGFDLAAILFFTIPCVLFDITCEQPEELKRLT